MQLIFAFYTPEDVVFQRKYQAKVQRQRNREYYRNKGKCGCGRAASPGLKTCTSCRASAANFKAKARKRNELINT